LSSFILKLTIYNSKAIYNSKEVVLFMTLDYYIVTKRGVVLKDTKENRKQAHEIIKDY